MTRLCKTDGCTSDMSGRSIQAQFCYECKKQKVTKRSRAYVKKHRAEINRKNKIRNRLIAERFYIDEAIDCGYY